MRKSKAKTSAIRSKPGKLKAAKRKAARPKAAKSKTTIKAKADTPRAIISPEAERFFEITKPQPFDRLTPADAERYRALRQEEQAPMAARLREALVDSVDRQTIGGVPTVIVRPKGRLASDAIAFYLHGGAYCFGMAFDIASMLMASKLKLPVFSVDYRLAPEHPYPAALDDAGNAYAELTRRFDPSRIVAFGVSAGSGLLLALMLAARDKRLPLPAALAVLTPWTDLTLIGDSYAINDGRDARLTRKRMLDKTAAAYAKGADLKSPLLSPVYGDYGGGFPPTLITTGTRDLFLSDCVRLHRNMKRARVPVELTVVEGMWHAFNVAPGVPEAEESRAEIAAFLTDALARQTASQAAE
jgi:epsilon-lactone hydrolase